MPAVTASGQPDRHSMAQTLPATDLRARALPAAGATVTAARLPLPQQNAAPLRVAMLLANPGTADPRVAKEAECLVTAGHAVTVYCLAGPGLAPIELRHGVRYVRCAEPHRRALQPPGVPGLVAAKPRSSLAKLRASLSHGLSAIKHALGPFIAHELHARTFVQRVAADAPDIIHAHDFEVLPAAVRIAKLMEKRCQTRPDVIYDMHEYELGRLPVPNRMLAAWKQRIEKNAVRQVTAAITVSPSIARVFSKVHGRDEPVLVLNAPVVAGNTDGVSGVPAPTLRDVLNLPAGTPLAVQVGTAMPGRGIETMLAALMQLPRLHLALVGAIRPEMMALLASAKSDPRIGDRLRLLPPVPHDQVVAFIASADIGICAVRPVCLSYEYCLPNKLFEMTLAGLPLVVSQTLDMARFVAQIGNGIITDTGDARSLAAAITRALAERQSLRPDAAKLAQLRKAYGWPAQAAKLNDLYRQISSQRQARAASLSAIRRRILMVNLIDWQTMCGGAQHQLGLFGAWHGAGHDVRMLSPRTPGETAPPAILEGHLEQVRSVRFRRLPAALDTLLECAALPGVARRFRPNLVYSRHNTLTPVLVLTCRLLGIPVVVEHNAWLPSQRRVDGGASWVGHLEGLGQSLATYCANGARTVTPGLAQHMTGMGVPARRMVAIGNGTDTERFRPVDRATAFATFGLDPARTTVGFIGNIMPWHGLDQAITGFAQAARLLGNVDLLIFGDGPCIPLLKSQAEQLGIASRVRWLGRVPLELANTAINCMDIALLPLSARDDIGFGFSAIKLRDYAAAGRVVLTGRLPGAIELEDEPWLTTHAPDDGDDLGRKLTHMLINRAHHAAAQAAAREYAVAHFDWRVIAGEIEQFFNARLQRRLRR